MKIKDPDSSLENAPSLERYIRYSFPFESDTMMRCAEIVSAGAALKFASYPVPQPPPDGVVIKTTYAGVCHSDLHLLDDVIDLGGGKTRRFSDMLGKCLQ